MPNNIPIKQGTLSKIPVPSTIGTPIGNTGYGTSKYDASVNYQDALYNLEEFRHNNQSSLDVVGNSLAHFAGSAVNAGLEIPAIAFGALKAPFVGWGSLAKGEGLANAEVDAFNAYFDNEISRQVVDPINQWFQDTFKVYSSQKQKDSNFFSYENLTSGHFLDALLSGAGYTAGSFVTGAALTKAFGLAKIAATGAKVGESAESLIAEAANTAKKSIPINLRAQLAIGTIMAGMESSLEARQTKDQILQELKNVSNLTDAQKQDIAESGSLANFAFNMGILVPTNSLVFGRLIRPGGDAIESGIKTAFNAEGKIIEKQIANKYLRTAAKIIKNPITESLIEEGGQEYLQFASNAAINDYLDNKYHGRNASILSSIGSALYDGIATKEGLENTVIGGLMGVVAGGAAHIRNGKEEADRKKAQLDYINKNLPKALDVIKDKILDADRSITYQQNMDQNIAESSKENKFNYYNNKHSALVSLVQQHLNAGTLGILVDRIKGLKTASKEEINKLFGNEITQADLERWDIDDTINSLVKDITNIKSIHENVQRILPNPYNLKTQPKEYLAFKELQNLLTHTASTIDNTTARIHNINEQLNRFGITFNNTLYNNLTKEEKKSYLESTKKEIEDTNPVHHAHLNKELNDILNLNKRKEVFTEAYNKLNSEKGIKETLEKIETKENPPKPEDKDIISNLEYSVFIDKGQVHPETLNSIANKVKNKQPLSERENDIFITKTKEINEIIRKSVEVKDEFTTVIEKKGVLGNKINVKVNQNGEWEDANGNIYKKEDNYYEPGKTSVNKGEQQVLYGEEHFTRMWFQGLADNTGFASKTRALINKIAQLPNWKDYINVRVTKSQVNANLEEEKKNGKKTLFGSKEVKLQGRYDIDILMDITDPETGEVPEEGKSITAINNPNLFVLNGVTIDFNDVKWTLTEFNKYFSNDDKKGGIPFTQKQFDSFKANWNYLKKFNDALVKWFSTQNKESADVPLDAIDYLLSGSIFWDKSLPLDSKEFGDTFKDSPIVLGTNPTVSTNGKSLENITADLAYDLAFQIDEKFRKSYFILAKLVNGLQRWVRIQAKETTAENVLSKLKEVQSDINKLTSNPTKEQADIITDKLDFWIASKPGNTIKFVHNFKLSGKLQLALGYGTNSKITDRVLLPDISNWEEKDLIDFINSILEPKGFEKVDISHFKQEIVPTDTNIDQFEIKVNPQILKDYTLLFKFNPEALGQEVETEEEFDLQSVVDDLERRREEELNSIPLRIVDGFSSVDLDKKREVNDKYDAEIATLKSKYPQELEAQIILARMADYSEDEIQELIKDWYKSNKDYNKTKIYSDESQLSTEPRTYAEITQRLREQVPGDIGIDRLDRILSTLNINGIPVGIFRDSTVFISEKMGYSDADHEAFHTIFNTVLTPVEQERYLKAKKRELNYTPEQLNSEVQQMLSERPDLIQLLKLKEITRQDVENLVIEEKLADDYADKRNSKELNKPTSWKQAIFNLFDKIVNFFTKNVKIIDLFNQIDKGAFVNSKIQVPNKLSSLVKAKLIGELTAEQSRNLISLVSAKYTNYNNTVSLERIVDELIEEYNPFSEGNIALVKSRNTELEGANLKKFLRVNNFALKNNKALIIDESTKYLKYLNFNPKKTEEDNFEIETDKDMKEFDRLDSEIPTLDRVSQEIKAFIGSTIYKTTFYGKEVETAVHFSEVYNKLLSILTNTEASKVLSTIKALGTKDIQMNALYNKLHTEKGYSKDSPKGITFEDEMFLTRFIKQFELARIPYVSVFTKDDKYLVKKTNKDDAGSYTFDQWSTAFSLNIDDKLIGDSEFRNELQYNLTLLISKLQDKPISDKWKYKNYLKSTAIKDILSSIGIDLNKEYLETLFDNTDEDSTILRDLITKENRNITVQDIYKLQDILLNNTSDTSEGKDNRNPFLDNQMSDRLLAISTGSSQFDNNFIIPNYRASDNTLRYTYVPYNYYSQSIQEIKDKYKNYQDIPTRVSDYLRYNPMFNSENRDLILQNISNLEITYIGDNTFDEGKTYKDSNEQDILRVLYGLFQNKDPKKQTYITAPSIIADKRSFYGIQVPFRNLWEKGELTEEGKELLKGLFTQEFKRLQGDFPNTNKNIFLYLPVFNNTNILDKIKSTSDINKYFESDILPILRNFIDSEVNNLKIEGVQLEKNDTYQFILNNLINNISIQQLTEGDLSQLSYKDLGTWEKSYNKLFSERFKRESSLNASGLNMGEGEDKVQYTEDTQAWVNKDTGEVQYNKPEDKELDKFHPKPINPDDAQVWQTPLGRLRDMQSLGKLTELHYSALEKLNGLVLDKNGNPEYPTKEELKNLDLISSKHVTSGFDTQGNRVYYKMSISPLIPWDLGYWSVVDKEWKPKKGFEEGFNRWKLMNDKNLDLLVPKSASKVFFGNIGETYSIPRKYRREQVLKESKGTNKVPWLTQIQQLIDFGLLDNENNNILRNTLQDIQVALRNNTFNFLKDQIVDSSGKLKEDLSFFLQKLRDTVESTTPDIQSIELLKSTFGKLDYTLNLAHTRNKMEQIFLSHFKDAFQHKLNGAKLTMRSPIVYKAIRDEKGNVIPGAERNSEKYKDYELSDLRVTWENSNPEGEIVISAFTANKLGLKIGDTVVSLRVPTQGYNFMGRSKIADILPEYMGDIVIAAPQLTLYAGQDFDDDSLYIFSKEKYNTLRGEILYGEEETLEERWEGYKNWYINNNQDFRLYLKNLVDNHKELQGLQNLDEILDTSSQTAVQIYDSLVQDTLKFFNLPSSITDYQLKNEPLSQGALNNELIKNLEEIIQQPELEKYFKQASTTDETKKTKEKIEKILGTDSLTLSMFTPSGLMKAWDDNTASTNLRGSTVLAQTTGANLTKNRVNLNPEYWITFNGITYKSFNTPDDVTYLKNNYSSEKVSTSIDNSKDPMASTFHWTKNNVSVFSYLNQLGINIKDGDGILSVQPSIIQASKVKPFALRYELRNWEQEYRTKFNEEVQGDNLTSKELWYSLEPSNRGTKEFYQTQIKALRLYMKASEIASFGFNISRLNTLTRTIGSSFDDARGFLNSYTELTVPKLNKKGEIIPNPFNIDKLLKREKNIINNVKNLETVLEIAKELFISETDTVRDIQNTLLKSLKAKKEGLHERVQKSLNTYLQMQIYKTLNPKVDFTGLITDSLKGSKKENLITSKFKNLMKYPEFTQNKFIKFLKPLEQGQKGNNTPLSILKFDSVTVPTKELSELFLDSVNSMYHSENPEIAQFAVDLLNYQAALGNMEFLNNSFMRFIPVVLLKDLAQNFQRLNTELAKPNPSEEIIKKITGKTSEELKKEFITNYLSNLNNSSDINSIPKEYKPLIQNYRFSTEVFGTDYKKPWLDTPQRNKELSDWLLTLIPKVDKSNPEPNNSDNIPDDSSNEEIPEDNLDNPKILSKLEENNEIMEIDFQEEQTSGYRNRTIKNASADATIAIAVDFTSAGEKLTKTSVLGQNKKYIPVDANILTVTKERVDKIVEQLNSINKSTEKINIYAGTNENKELSNLADRPFEDKTEWKGLTFRTVEGAYQAAKLQLSDMYDKDDNLTKEGDALLDKLQEADGFTAKRLGQQVKGLNTKEWDRLSSHIMKGLLLESFKQNPKALEQLLATGNAELTHTQDKGKWGKEFPKLLMEVRQELGGQKQSKGITLNIAGNGIYTMKGKYTQQQVDDFTYDLLNQVINSPNLKTKIESIRSGGQTGFDEAGAKAGIKLGLPTIVLAPKEWTFRNINGQDISNEQQFKDRFKNISQVVDKNQLQKQNIKEGVKELFKSNPELANVGTQQQYSAYLDTIFPDSKVKDIVYHFSKDKNKQDFKNTKSALSKETDGSIHFGTLEQAQSRESNIERELFESQWDNAGKKTAKDYAKELYNKPWEKLTTDEQAEVIYLEQIDSENTLLDNLAKIKEGKIYPALINSTNIREFSDAGLNNFNFKNIDTVKYLNKVEAGWNPNYSFAVKNPEQIHILGSKQDIEGFKQFVNKNISQVVDSGIDKQLNEKIKAKLQQLYPQIKLEYTNVPIEESSNPDVFNQIIENEMGEDYWKELYSNRKLSNIEEFESVKIPTIKNKYKPDYENVYHGTNSYHLDSEGNLILTPSHNFENKTESISLTQIPIVAQDYMLRKQGNVIIKINNDALPSNYTIESAEEIAINGNKPFIVKKGMFEIIKVQTLAEKMKAKYANEVEQRAEELKARAKSDLHLLDAIYSERIAADNYSEIQEYENDSQREQAPDWYVPDEYLDSRAANKVYSDLKNKINKNWVIKALSDLLIDKIKTTGDYIPSIEGALEDISQYGNRNAPHQSTLWEELLNEIGLGFKHTYFSAYNTDEEITKAKAKQKEKEDLIDKIEELVNNSEKSSMDFYNSKEQKEKREEQKRIDEENHKKWLQNLSKYRQEIDDLPFQKVDGKIIGQANIKAMSVLIDAVNQKQDTLPHEYAHHYIAWYRNTPIVQEAIKKWGSEEALVQSIGEQVVKQKGEAYNWWNNFVKWILNQFNSLSKLQKEELTQILTDAFLTRQDLGSNQDIEGFKEFISQVVDSGIDESLNEKIRIKLQQLYPQIKLEYTNKPIEESNDEDVFNQDLNRFDADSRKAIYQLSLPLLKAKAAVEAFSEKAKMTVLTTAETLISENPLKYLHVSNYGKTGNVFVNIEELAKDLFKEFGEQVIPERFKQEAKAFYDNIHEPTQFEKPFENYKYNLEKVLKYEELELKNINSILKTDNNSALFNLLTKGIPTYYNQKSRYHSFNLKDDNGQVFTYSYKDGKLDHINKLVTEIEYKDWLGKEVKEGRTIKRHHSIDENEKIDAMLTLTKLQKDTNRLKLGIQKTILRTLENSIQLQKDRLKDPKLKDDFIYNEIGFKYDSMGGFSERDIERHGIETLLENVLKINNIIDEDKYLSKEIGVKADKLLEITNNEEYTTLKNKQKKINYILGHKEEFNNEYDNFEANFEDGDLLAPIPEWFLNAVSVMQTGKYFNEHKGFAAGFVKGFIHLEAKRQYDELHENNIQPKFQELVETKDINSLLTKGISFVKAVNLSNNLAILNQKDKNRIIGQANIKAMSVLIDAINQKQDTLPHEYAHHYIAWYRNTPIVQEAIKKWGSEEALVQSIGEQVVKQKGEAFDWWNKFCKWILDKFNSLSKLQKEELTQILTDAFLTNQKLDSGIDASKKTYIEEDELYYDKDYNPKEALSDIKGKTIKLARSIKWTDKNTNIPKDFSHKAIYFVPNNSNLHSNIQEYISDELLKEYNEGFINFAKSKGKTQSQPLSDEEFKEYHEKLNKTLLNSGELETYEFTFKNPFVLDNYDISVGDKFKGTKTNWSVDKNGIKINDIRYITDSEVRQLKDKGYDSVTLKPYNWIIVLDKNNPNLQELKYKEVDSNKKIEDIPQNPLDPCE